MSEERSVWLDQIPYAPTPEDCVRCGFPLRPNESLYVAWVSGAHFCPLHRECFDALSVLDGFDLVAHPWVFRPIEPDEL